jgi:hypothetical protein
VSIKITETGAALGARIEGIDLTRAWTKRLSLR